MDAFDYEATIAGCARRDPVALRRLYDREAPFLLGLARRILRRDDAARDVLHDSFLDVWQRAETFDPQRGAGRAWIAGIVRHRAFKVLRRDGREAELDDAARDAVPDDAPDAFARLAQAQDGTALHRCLDRLEPVRRRVLILAYVDGLSQTEIAGRLATPLGTVKAWTRRSLISLKECLA